MDDFPLSINWYSYLTRFLPGWPWPGTAPEQHCICGYTFSLLLVFLLTFIAEFFSKSPITINRRDHTTLAAAAAQRAMAMFMLYLAIVVIIATDYVFFLVAVAGHFSGNFLGATYEYECENEYQIL